MGCIALLIAQGNQHQRKIIVYVKHVERHLKQSHVKSRKVMRCFAQESVGLLKAEENVFANIAERHFQLLGMT